MKVVVAPKRVTVTRAAMVTTVVAEKMKLKPTTVV
jgi:hypothetical protein